MRSSATSLLLHLLGRKSIWLIFAFGALIIVRFIREHELPPMARETILLRLKADYSRKVLEEMKSGSRDRATLEEQAAMLARRQRVEIRSTTRGILWPKFVRLEVSVDGQPPPLGDAVRYFTIDWSGNATSEISGFKYHCHLW